MQKPSIGLSNKDRAKVQAYLKKAEETDDALAKSLWLTAAGTVIAFADPDFVSAVAEEMRRIESEENAKT